tara:strand:- start:118 stop:441 length:324 start_codon:yes stop_codon:yes gene_type:complete
MDPRPILLWTWNVLDSVYINISSDVLVLDHWKGDTIVKRNLIIEEIHPVNGQSEVFKEITISFTKKAWIDFYKKRDHIFSSSYFMKMLCDSIILDEKTLPLKHNTEE